MQKSLFFKIFLIGLLAIFIYVPLTMIQSTIWERMRYRDEAVRSITADSVSEQMIVGPVLVIPYTETWEEDSVDATTQKVMHRQMSASKEHFVYPNEMQVVGKVSTDQRYRGIHQVLVYTGEHTISGDFNLPVLASLVSKDKTKSAVSLTETPYITMGLSDTRGLQNFPKLKWNEQVFEFRQGSQLSAFTHGIHANIDGLQLTAASTVKFKLDLLLDGIEKLSFVPIAKNNQVTLSSSWPHPQYGGRFLPSPKGRVRNESGFSANWNISALSSNAQQQFNSLESAGHAVRMTSASSSTEDAGAVPTSIDTFNVSFIEPVNIYSQADRAVKYGLMFVALTFAAFFLFEVLKQLPIHPIQYLLVGLAMAIFFLLLVSLSEKISFVLAYLSASVACIVLIGFYLSHVLRDWKRGFGFGGALTVLYGILFGLLQSESNALVMGSILLFAVLSAIMVVTRKVDWYQLGKAVPARIA
ncbi:cell envelope integrity protein CreD [Undibacterium sp. TS12]|uniref:cell envelope integrity protein CreD n=1 Tax=Undibacterium sp. TS12 TaxID=2908202 RepID=UPI001F4D27B6|nr:cell envelope integrity protein CreD [Undibacterium sp. TS12]MCH8620291.1 cell envelope integrity protein CreD [Undibacterium sp. TS12]